MPPLGDDGEQPRVDEPPEVLAGGRRRDARLRGQDTRRQRAPVPERQQHPGPCPLAEDGAEGGEIRVAADMRGGHGFRLDPGRFGGGRNMASTCGGGEGAGERRALRGGRQCPGFKVAELCTVYGHK